MENWFKDVGRPALFEAFVAACDRVGDDFDNNITQLVQDNTRLQDELEPLKIKAASVERLQEENRLLREEIQSLKAIKERPSSKKDSSANQEMPTPTPSLESSTRTPLAPRSVNEATPFRKPSKLERSDLDKFGLPELREEYRRLEGNHSKLHEKYLEALSARTELDHRLREKIKNVEQWMKHANELNAQSQKRLRKVKRLEVQLASIGGNAASFAASFSSDTSDNVPTTTTIIRRYFPTIQSKAAGESTNDGPTDVQSVTGARNSDHAPVGDGTEQVPSIHRQDSGKKSLGGDSTQTSTRETTHEEDAPSLPPLPEKREDQRKVITIKEEPSSDTPVVVYERSVRKRRREGDEVEHKPVATRVKTEEDSDPVVFEERRHFAPQESMDFDAEIPHVQTPRKNRLRSMPEDDDIVGTPEPPQLQYSSTRSALRHNQPAIFTRSENNISQETRPADGIRPASACGNERAIANITPLLPTDRSSALRPPGLDPLSGRISRSSKARSAGSARFQRGFASLAEDDDRYQASRTSRSLSREPRSSKVLSGPLNSYSAERGIVPPSAAAQTEDMSASKPPSASGDLHLKVPPKRELPFNKDRSRKASESLQEAKSLALSMPSRATIIAQPKRKSVSGGGSEDGTNISAPPITRANNDNSSSRGNARNTGVGPAKDRTPLRDRSLSQLRLDDFRINPAANEGYEYAFTDVVRTRAERASALVGCVRESCCGPQYRTLARAERPLTGPVSFQALLEEYLGDDAAKRRLPGMPQAEKEALWLEAKMRQLADAHGRCRHRYQRMASPPGFWRTDFPSTQEVEDDRAQGQKMEAEMIQERYREAMRPGGRWLFRDEVNK